MKSLSAKQLVGARHERWVAARSKVYRNILRDPRSSDARRRYAADMLTRLGVSPR